MVYSAYYVYKVFNSSKLFIYLINTKLHMSDPKKIALSLMHHHPATICSRITRFSPKCSGKMKGRSSNQAMQNLYQLVKYSLINSQNWIDWILWP